MKGIGRPQAERLAALALAALGGICGAMLWSEAERLQQQSQHQRELLAQLAAARLDAAGQPPGRLTEFDSLFAGLHVVCAPSAAGQMLQLQSDDPAKEAQCSR